MHSLHTSHLHLFVEFCCVIVCLVIRFPKFVQKYPHMHVGVLGLARGLSLEKTHVFSFGFTTIGETAVVIGGPDC